MSSSTRSNSQPKYLVVLVGNCHVQTPSRCEPARGLCLGLIMHGCKGAGSLGEEEEQKGRKGKTDKSVKAKSAVVEGRVGINDGS